MACWVLVLMAPAIAGSAMDSEPTAINRDYLSVMIPVQPRADAHNARARTTILTTRGASFGVVETREEILAKPCMKEQRGSPD